MKTKTRLTSFFVIALTALFSATGQLLPDQYKTLLPESIMDEIIGECSGETAMNHMIEM